MDNNVFNKRLKSATIVIASIVVLLLIVWFSTKDKNNDNQYSDSHNTVECCFNNLNYFEVLSIEDAIKSAYKVCGLTEDPSNYKNYEETLQTKYSRQFEFLFKTIDGYKLFMSDKSACNRGKEPLKSFICNMVQSDRVFFKSRTAGAVYVKLMNEDLPNFKFYYILYGEYGGTICSWEKITEGSATYVIADGMDIIYRYTFTRIEGLWYLTDYYENEWY